MDCIKCKATLPEGALYCHLCGKKQGPQERKRRKRANGTGTIYKLHGNRVKPWAASRNGVYIGSYKTYTDAQKALERLTDMDVNDKFNLTFAQIYERWRPVHARTVTKGQMSCYATAYKQSAQLHDQKFRSLRKSDFQEVILQLEQRNKSKSTCEKVLQLFGQLSKWAMEEGIISQNYSANVTIVAKQKTIKRPFTEEQIALIKNSGHRAADIVLILIATGARISEFFTVPLSDCRDTYFIGGNKTEEGRNRVIAVSPIGLDAYRRLLERARAEGGQLLIDGYSGNRDAANFRKRDFDSLMELIGATDMTPHCCRHTFSTIAVRSGVSAPILRRMLGHADIKTTDKIYTHLDTDDILEEICKVDNSYEVANKSQTSQNAS